MTVDLSKLSFYSGENYMKRDDSSSYRDLTVGSGSNNSYSVAHNLGYIPQFDVWGILAGDGIIWTNNLPYVDMEGAGGTPVAATLSYWIDTADLTLRLDNFTGGSITARLYWLIYKDYGNA